MNYGQVMHKLIDKYKYFTRLLYFNSTKKE